MFKRVVGTRVCEITEMQIIKEQIFCDFLAGMELERRTSTVWKVVTFGLLTLMVYV